jgi:hypothetical protein
MFRPRQWTALHEMKMNTSQSRLSMPYLVQGQNHYLANLSNIQIEIGYVLGVLEVWRWKVIPSKPLAFLVASEQLLPRPFLELERPGLVGWMERSYRR